MQKTKIGRDNNIWHCLAQIYPVNAILVLGPTADHMRDVFCTIDADQAVFADSRPDFERSVSLIVGDQKNPKILDTIVDDEAAERVYFELSVRSESGLLSPSLLAQFWPNIHSLSEITVQTTSLAHILATGEPAFNWLIINRLDSIKLCSSAGSWTNLPHIIVVRAALAQQTEPAGEMTCESQILDLLSPFGYRRVTAIPGGNPQFVQLVLARSAAAIISDEVELLRDKIESQNKDQQIQAEDELARRMTESQNQLSQVMAESEKYIARLSIAENNLADLKDKHRELSRNYDKQCANMHELERALRELQSLVTQNPINTEGEA